MNCGYAGVSGKVQDVCKSYEISFERIRYGVERRCAFEMQLFDNARRIMSKLCILGLRLQVLR